MEKDGNRDAGPSGLLSNHDASSNEFEPSLSANMTDRLEKLAKWRMDQSSIEFPKEAREFTGGHATVSQAFLATPTGSKDNTNHFNPTKNYDLDSSGPAAETSRPLKAVAVKKIKMSQNIARVLGLTLREAEFLVGLSHENIIKLEGFVEDLSKDIIWLVFPWEENGTLRDFIASADWEIPERIFLINDVAEGVEYLHNQRAPIRHGDLKSINVLVNSKSRAVITDFGSARHIQTKDPNRETKPAQHKPPATLSLEATFCALTNTITLTGDHYTLRWAAPEQLFEEEPSLCSDIWALGWVAYEVMTNSIPFENVRDAVVIRRVIQGDLPSITTDSRMALIQALSSVMLVCWSIDPSKRPTAETCRKSISWMPMVIPNPIRTTDTAASRGRSPGLLMQLGYMYWLQGDYPNALDFYTKAVGGYADNGNRRGEITALVQLAQVHRFRNEYSQAIPFYSEALKIGTDIGDRRGRADALWGLAEVHRVQDEYSKAITFYSESLQIRTDIDDRQGKASALWGLADIHRLRNEYSQAITFYSEDLQIRNDLGDRQGRADALWGLAEVHRLRKEYSQAVTFYSQALQICTDIGNSRGRADALKGLADVHRFQNEPSQAITLYMEALQIRTDIGDRRGRASALKGLAEVHRLREEYSQAIPFYSEALQILTDIGDRYGSASALKSLAGVRRLRNQFSQAIALFSEALQICTDIGDQSGRAFALLGLADVHRDQEDHSNAIRCYTEAAEVFEQIGDTQGAAYASHKAAERRQ